MSLLLKKLWANILGVVYKIADPINANKYY